MRAKAAKAYHVSPRGNDANVGTRGKPWKTLERAHRAALKPGGVILVQVPYELYHWEKIGQALWERKKPGTVAPDAVPYHVTFFTPRTLKAMLQKNGFAVLARYSGNYGAIRKYLSPPEIRVGSALETAARFIYYKLGLRPALQTLALWFKQGSGAIYVATPA